MIVRFKRFTRRHALAPAVMLVLLAAFALTKSSAQQSDPEDPAAQFVVGVGPAWETLKAEAHVTGRVTTTKDVVESPRAADAASSGFVVSEASRHSCQELAKRGRTHHINPTPYPAPHYHQHRLPR